MERNMSRTLAREDAFKLIFEMEVTKRNSDEALDYLFDTVEKTNEMWAQNSISDANEKYIRELVKGVEMQKEALNEKIAPTLKSWTIDRLSKVNLAVLQLAIYEILFMEDIPHKVSVNEAVQLAKKYAGKEAGSFVNGVLGTLIKSVENVEGN